LLKTLGEKPMANILVIDDDEEIRDFLEMVLTEDNHNVTLAKDGLEGIMAVRRNHFDLVITDIIMPNKDGIDFILDLVNADNTVPIIAMSGGRRQLSSEFQLQSAATLGVKITLKKPFSAFDLRRIITEILG
jgi:CheY-like chemotaxis protein